MRITCLIDSLSYGGAEKVMTILAGGLARRGHRVGLLTLSPGIPDFFSAPDGVTRSALPTGGNPRWYDLPGQARRLRELREAVSAQSPEAVISFIDATNVLALLALPPGKPPVIACERIHPAHHDLSPHWKLLRRLAYPRAARVVMLTEDSLRWAAENFPGWRAAVIPNPVPAPQFSPDAARPEFFGGRFNAVAAGRLHRQKGFDLLLESFAGIAAGFPDWQLTILGEGPERAALESLAGRLGLSGRVKFPGLVKNAADAFRFADLFLLSSRYEGFPNALTEALACGLPAVSYDCPSGPSEILRSGVDGLLVPPGDSAAFAAAMKELMGNAPRRELMAKRAPEIRARFSPEAYLDSWEKLLAELPAA